MPGLDHQTPSGVLVSHESNQREAIQAAIFGSKCLASIDGSSLIWNRFNQGRIQIVRSYLSTIYRASCYCLSHSSLILSFILSHSVFRTSSMFFSNFSLCLFQTEYLVFSSPRRNFRFRKTLSHWSRADSHHRVLSSVLHSLSF